MRKIVFLTIVILFSKESIYGGEWIGSNLIYNWNFDIYQGSASNTGIPGWDRNNSQEWHHDNGNVNTGNLGDTKLQQVVSVEIGKRYRVSGTIAVHSILWGMNARAQVSSDGIASTSWWSANSTRTPSSKSIEAISTVNSTTFNCVYDFLSGSGTVVAYYYEVGLNKVIYDPQINILEESLQLNALTSVAVATLNLQDHSFADTPTHWWIDWGDGTIDYNPLLNSLAEHTYDISNGVTGYTATLYGENQAGSMTDTVAITIVPEPMTISLLAIGWVLIRKR